MQILAIGSDRSIINPHSGSSARQVAYGAVLKHLDIIVFSTTTQKLHREALSLEVNVYPTNSQSRLLYGWDAIRIARTLSKPDVVSVQDPFEAGLIGWVIARLRGAKLHVQVHTDICSPEFKNSFLNMLRVLIAGFVLKRADRIRVVSNRIKEGIEKKYAPRAPITVLPIFVDVAKFRSAHAGILAGRFQNFKTRILVVARLEKEKNVSLALESFAKVTSHDSCLIILGDGRERRALEKRASSLGLGSRIFFEGTTDTAPYYAAADLLLVPSRYEGYGLVIIEALAAGKPVLSTDVGIAREAGAIIADQAHFADALKEWIASGQRSAELQNYPYESFEQYVEAYTTDIKALESGF